MLSNPEKREIYDQYGKAGLSGSGIGNGFQGSASDMARDFFQRFGRGFNPFPGFQIPVVVRLDLSLEDLYNGRRMSVPIGANNKVQLNIEPGMANGVELVVRGGVASSNTDLIFRINEQPHPIFTRQNADLLVTISVRLEEALFGFYRNISHLDGQIVQIKSPLNQTVEPDSVYCLDNMGMPIYKGGDRKGKLFVRVKLVMPAVLKGDQNAHNKFLEAYRSVIDDRPRYVPAASTNSSFQNSTSPNTFNSSSDKKNESTFSSSTSLNKRYRDRHTQLDSVLNYQELKKTNLQSFGSTGQSGLDEDDDSFSSDSRTFERFFFR